MVGFLSGRDRPWSSALVTMHSIWEMGMMESRFMMLLRVYKSGLTPADLWGLAGCRC